MQIIAPPNLEELQRRCREIEGQPLRALAELLHLNIPAELLHAKGWVGQLLETYLGATASSKAMPDFPGLGIELKTIPIDKSGKPLESTYVCTVQTNNNSLSWHDSWVYRKLKHVLWIPIISSPELAISERIITKPFFWQMDEEIEDILRTDWEELMDMLQLGYGKQLNAKFGTYLHIRPKAANSRVLIDYMDSEGNATKIVPKGFYLRSTFTRLLAQAHTE
jgi:DNA mismatch repair protein MutH